MRLWLTLTALALLCLASSAEAKKFRYASGPRPAADTLGWVAEGSLEPVVGSRRTRVPLTNLQITSLVADTAFSRALRSAPLDSGLTVVVAPAESHPLNFVVEHAILRDLSRRGVRATVRRSIIPDDSLRAMGAAGDPILEYQLATARVTYLRLVGYLPGRVKVERQALVEGGLTLREPATTSVRWVADAGFNLVDRFPRAQASFVEDERFSELKGTLPDRNAEKVFEPVIVVAVVGGLVALFFQNRP